MTKKNILIAEDEPNLRNSLKELLDLNGYEVRTAENGTEALAHLSSSYTPDLIISDIVMPGMDGIALFKNIQNDSSLRSTPFIFLRARAEIDEIRLGMGLGADDYITKPVRFSELLKCIEVRISKRETIRSEIRKETLPADSEATSARKAELSAKLQLISVSEKRVLDALSSDKTSVTIAKRLFLSIKTVQNHRSHMAIKLGMSGQNSLLAFAVECKTLGLI
jgi:DNA-binding NarL/FixJ family response regulator